MADLSALNIQAKDNSAPEYALLPKGYYKVVALKEELKDTKSGGQYISIEFEVIDNKHKLWGQYNIVNSNNVTVEIAIKQLESFAWAVGIITLKTSEELLYKEFTAYVDVTPETTGKDGTKYKAKNEIKGYYPATWTIEQIESHRKGKSKSGETSVPTASPVGATPVGAGASPWARK